MNPGDFFQFKRPDGDWEYAKAVRVDSVGNPTANRIIHPVLIPVGSQVQIVKARRNSFELTGKARVHTHDPDWPTPEAYEAERQAFLGQIGRNVSAEEGLAEVARFLSGRFPSE